MRAAVRMKKGLSSSSSSSLERFDKARRVVAMVYTHTSSVNGRIYTLVGFPWVVAFFFFPRRLAVERIFYFIFIYFFVKYVFFFFTLDEFLVMNGITCSKNTIVCLFIKLRLYCFSSFFQRIIASYIFFLHGISSDKMYLYRLESRINR